MAGVPDTPAFNTADADGIVTVFNFLFYVVEEDDIKVFSVLNDVETEITSGITKAIDSDFIGGSVTFAVAPADALGSILIRREVAYDQTTEFADITTLKETAIETALNSLALQIQQIRDKADLGVQYSEAAGVTDAIIETPVDGSVLTFSGILGRIKATTLASLSLTGLDTLFTGLTSGDLFSWNGANWINLAQIATTQIADDAVTADKLADTAVSAAAYTSADITVDAQGRVTAAASGSAGGLVLLGTATASASASVDFINGVGGIVFDGTYEEYELHVIDFIPTTDEAKMWARTTTDASTFDSGAGHYAHATAEIASGGASVTLIASNSATEIVLTQEVGSAAGESAHAIIKIFDPAGTNFTHISVHAPTRNGSGSAIHNHVGGGARLSAANVDGIQVLASTSTIASAKLKLYGVVKS